MIERRLISLLMPLFSVLMLAEGCAHRAASAPAVPHPCARIAPAERAACLEEHGGVLFAIGQEPGWTLVLFRDSFSLELDYGETRIRGTSAPVRAETEGSRVLHFRGGSPRGTVEIHVREILCHDVMSGEPYPAEVIVTLPGRAERGCGFLVGD
jgi:uncharacterized membrane protein